MPAIEDIIVNIVSGVVTVNRVGFGIPVIVGLTGQRSVLFHGSGSTGLVAKSTPRQNAVNLEIVIGTGFAYAFAGSTVTIDLPAAGSTVRDLIADFNANAPSIVTDELTLALPTGQTGAGSVAVLSPTALTFTEFRQILDITELDFFYDDTDIEFIMFQNMLNSVPTVRHIFLIDEFNGGSPDITQALLDNDTGQWYAILTTSTDESDQLEISDYANNNQRLAILVSDSSARLDVVQGKKTAYMIHDAPDDHPEASWAAKKLPKDPGSTTWKYERDLFGQTVNSTASLTDLTTVRSKKGQSYVSKSGVNYVDEGQTVDPAKTPPQRTYIDQIRSRDWIQFNMEGDILVLFVQVPKIPYTDQGIAQVVSVITNRLSLAGQAGIIAPVENSDQAALSSDGDFRFNVQFPTRASLEVSDPSEIDNRNLPDVTFSYVEAGAIHTITVNGRVILSETG